MGFDTPDSIVIISDPAKHAGLLLLLDGLATGADVGDWLTAVIACAITPAKAGLLAMTV